MITANAALVLYCFKCAAKQLSKKDYLGFKYLDFQKRYICCCSVNVFLFFFANKKKSTVSLCIVYQLFAVFPQLSSRIYIRIYNTVNQESANGEFNLKWCYICCCLNPSQNGMLPFSKWEFVIAWSFREFGALYLFCQALWDPTIRWRAGTYRLSWGGQVQEIMSFQRPHKPLTLTPHSINNVCFNGSKIPPSSHSMTGSFEMAKSLDRNEKSTIVLADDLDLNSNRGKC